MAETNTTVTETNKAENGSTGAYGGDPTQAVKGGANLPEKAVSTSEPEQTAKTFTQAEALRKNLCKNNQPQKNDFVLRAADQSLSFLFQYKLNTAVCQAPDAKYPDATERSEIKIFCGGISSACPDTLSQAHRAPCPSPEAALSIFWISPLLPDTELLKVLYRSEIRSSACSDGDSRC